MLFRSEHGLEVESEKMGNGCRVSEKCGGSSYIGNDGGGDGGKCYGRLVGRQGRDFE